jgi:hypothetical protein
MKLCPHCSYELEDEAVRCGNCNGWVIPNRKRKKAPSTRRGLKRVVLILAVFTLTWVVWNMSGTMPDPAAILKPEPSRANPIPTLEDDLARLQGLQETYYRNHGEYSGKPEDLTFTPSEKVNVSIIATPSGWSGAATHQDFPPEVGCAVFEGSALPPRTPITPSDPGEIRCSGGSS